MSYFSIVLVESSSIKDTTFFVETVFKVVAPLGQYELRGSDIRLMTLSKECPNYLCLHAVLMDRGFLNILLFISSV